jgi:hypothetical protein
VARGLTAALPAIPESRWSDTTPIEAVRGFLPTLGDCFVFVPTTPVRTACLRKGKEITPFVDSESGKGDEAFPDCRASEPLFEDRLACPACSKKSLRFSFPGMWD